VQNLKTPADGNLELSSQSSLGDVSVNSDLNTINISTDLREDENVNLEKLLQQEDKDE
jgi:hypothetical protein